MPKSIVICRGIGYCTHDTTICMQTMYKTAFVLSFKKTSFTNGYLKKHLICMMEN